MTVTDQLTADLVARLKANLPAGVPDVPIHQMLEGVTRPIPVLIISTDPAAEREAPFDNIWRVNGRIDYLTDLDETPVAEAQKTAGAIEPFLNALTGQFTDNLSIHDMQAMPAESSTANRHALHRVPFEAVVQPCE